MAKITYNGEADSISWFGVSFPKGKAVETDNEALIAKAQRNPFFKTAAKVDAETKAAVEADNAARKEAEEQRQRDEEEEAARALELNAAYGAGADIDPALTDDTAATKEGDEPASPRRGRPRQS